MPAPNSPLNDEVFINCPFDSDFLEVFRAIVFAVKACQFVPRTALDESDSGRSRIDKISRLIAGCDWGIHDLSAVELDKATSMPRFNMPLELGIALGAKWHGNKRLKAKRILILDEKPHQYDASTSDLSGQDVSAHHRKPEEAISRVRDFLAQDRDPALPPLPGGIALAGDYRTARTFIDKAISDHRLDPWAKLSHPDYLRLVDAALLLLGKATAPSTPAVSTGGKSV